MRTAAVLTVLCCVVQPGCAVCKLAKRTTLDEPAEFSWKADRKRSLEIYRTWAEEAWLEYDCAAPELGGSNAFEAGFKDGFVEFVYAGGTGQPPPIPPRRFWNVGFRTPEGHEASDDWFAGYRAGAAVARNDGYRRRATIRTSSIRVGPGNANCVGDSDGVDPNYVVPSPFPQDAESNDLELIEPGRIESDGARDGPTVEELPADQTNESDVDAADEAAESNESDGASPDGASPDGAFPDNDAPKREEPTPQDRQQEQPLDLEDLFRDPDVSAAGRGATVRVASAVTAAPRRKSRTKSTAATRPSKVRTNPFVKIPPKSSAVMRRRPPRRKMPPNTTSEPVSNPRANDNSAQVLQRLPTTDLGSPSYKTPQAASPTPAVRSNGRGEPGDRIVSIPHAEDNSKAMFYRHSTKH